MSWVISETEDSLEMRTIAALLLSLLTVLWQSAAAGPISLADHAANILAADAAAAPAAGDDRTGSAGHDAVPAAAPEAVMTPPPTPEMQFVSLGRITFIFDKWTLTDQSKRTLDTAARYLADHPGVSRLLLRGHTDRVGRQSYNDGLSDRRAAAVLDYLVKQGVPLEQVRWEGHGEHAPIDENWTRLGRARNRQVEMFAIFPTAAVSAR